MYRTGQFNRERELSPVRFYLKTKNIKKFGKTRNHQLNRWNYKPGWFDQFSTILFIEKIFRGLLGFWRGRCKFFYSILKILKFGIKGDFGRHLLWEKSHICLRSCEKQCEKMIRKYLRSVWFGRGVRMNCRIGLEGESNSNLPLLLLWRESSEQFSNFF